MTDESEKERPRDAAAGSDPPEEPLILGEVPPAEETRPEAQETAQAGAEEAAAGGEEEGEVTTRKKLRGGRERRRKTTAPDGAAGGAQEQPAPEPPSPPGPPEPVAEDRQEVSPSMIEEYEDLSAVTTVKEKAEKERKEEKPVEEQEAQALSPPAADAPAAVEQEEVTLVKAPAAPVVRGFVKLIGDRSSVVAEVVPVVEQPPEEPEGAEAAGGGEPAAPDAAEAPPERASHWPPWKPKEKDEEEAEVIGAEEIEVQEPRAAAAAPPPDRREEQREEPAFPPPPPDMPSSLRGARALVDHIPYLVPIPDDEVPHEEPPAAAPLPVEEAPPEEEPEIVGEVAAAQDAIPTTRPRRKWYEEIFDEDYLRLAPRTSAAQRERAIDFVEKALDLPTGATILDVGCGAGTHCIGMALRGYQMVGLDLSFAMLAVAGEEAQKAGTKINFIQKDMRELDFDLVFDGVICVGSTFGYFDDEENDEVIRGILRALKPGGTLLLEVDNRDFVMQRQPGLLWFENEGTMCMEETSFDFLSSRFKVKRSIIFDDSRKKTCTYSLRVYAIHELGRMLHKAGFRVDSAGGSRTIPKEFLGEDSPRIIVVAQKRLPDEA